MKHWRFIWILLLLVSLVSGFAKVNGYDATGNVTRVTNSTLTLDSYYDLQVAFEEVGVGINGQPTWKVLGPDLDGHYGSLQGVGGLEARWGTGEVTN